jgi:hypothetical protein
MFLFAQEEIFTHLCSALEDPEFRYQFVNFADATETNRELIAKARMVGNFYENLGRLVRHDMLNANLVLEAWSPAIVGDWKHLEGVTILVRRSTGKVVWENFEYLTAMAQGWLEEHRDGTITGNWHRLALEDKWLPFDERYAASREKGSEVILT